MPLETKLSLFAKEHFFAQCLDNLMCLFLPFVVGYIASNFRSWSRDGFRRIHDPVGQLPATSTSLPFALHLLSCHIASMVLPCPFRYPPIPDRALTSLISLFFNLVYFSYHHAMRHCHSPCFYDENGRLNL